MVKKETKSLFSWFVMTILAWLGLAGLSDQIVEWQAWFEQGVMQHWRSVKEWVIAILLWWVPFRVPSWLIDYSIFSAIVIRRSPFPKWNERWRFGPVDALGAYGYIPFIWKLDWAMGHVFLRWPALILLFVSWPLALPLLLAEAIRGKAFSPQVEISTDERRRQMVSWLSRMSWCFISFVPILFVSSNLLYEHG